MGMIGAFSTFDLNINTHIHTSIGTGYLQPSVYQFSGFALKTTKNITTLGGSVNHKYVLPFLL